MIVEYLSGLGVWNWFILAGILLALELFVPGTFVLWLGMSAAVVGVLSLIIAWPWQAQLTAFAILSVVSVIFWWRMGPRRKINQKRPFLNRRSESFVGRVVTLEKPIVDGEGTVRIADTIWRVRGPELSAGSRVRISAADGALLTVVQADD